MSKPLKLGILIFAAMVVAMFLVVLKVFPAEKKKVEMCQRGSTHHCSCPKQVMRARDAAMKQCETSADEDYIACIGRIGQSECQIIQQPDREVPADSCKAACSHRACGCHSDAPVCDVHGFDYGAAQRHSEENE